MPSKYNHPKAKQPVKVWTARVKKDYVEYYLGRFETSREAEVVEDMFRKAMGWPSMPAKSHRREVNNA